MRTDNRQYSGRPEDQENMTMNNDDERDYDEEQYSAHLLDDEEDPEDDGYDTGSLAKEDARNAWQHDEDTPYQFTPGEGTYTRGGHRTEALHFAGMAERSDPEFVPGLGFAALTHAVLALSAPEPGPDSSWRQRAVEAEAALTAIGGILANPGYPGNKLEDVEDILREAMRQADRRMPRPGGPPA